MIYRLIGKKDNENLLNETLGKIASNKISGRFKIFGDTWNKEVIENIKKKGNEDLEYFLNKILLGNLLKFILLTEK